MPIAVGFLLLLVGFAMLVAGVGLLIGGEITFKSGKKIPKRTGRKSGIAFLSFFPLGVVAHFAMRFFDPEHDVPPAAIYWPLAVLCLGTGLIWLQRGTHRGKPQRAYTMAPTVGPLDDLGSSAVDTMPLEFDAAPASEPPARKPVRPAKRSIDPFDFS